MVWDQGGQDLHHPGLAACVAVHAAVCLIFFAIPGQECLITTARMKGHKNCAGGCNDDGGTGQQRSSG